MIRLLFLWMLLGLLLSCNQKPTVPSKEKIDALNLKRGEMALCGAGENSFGTVEFPVTCLPQSKKDFDLGIALLHSFEYDEAEKVFAKIIDTDPACAMAYWGVAMCNYHEVWPSPPSPSELDKGNKAIAIAQSITGKTQRESDYIGAMAVFYHDWNTTDHRTRSVAFSSAMEQLYKKYPDDKEAAIFYALSLVGSADPADKTYKNQKAAGDILMSLYAANPDHPGIVHYIIHAYDYPSLAELALPAARKYASIAPSSAHAQHMPSHIFTRLGLWDESIQSNLASISAAQCYAGKAGIQGHWDEELHGMDYLVYAYLQKGENDKAKQEYERLETINEVYPVNFKDAYAFAAIPARYFLENKMWKEAAALKFHPEQFPWQKFPWQKAIVHFARLLGAAHISDLSAAKLELENLQQAYDTLDLQKDTYKANQVLIQIRAGEAWILWSEHKMNEALEKMRLSADMEDKTEKSPVTPCEVLPAEELLADMLLQLNKPTEALQAYEEDLKTHPNRFNALFGAGLAAEKSGQKEKAENYYRQLLVIANTPDASRPELGIARSYLKNLK